MSTSSHPVERLFPFALRARLVVAGREPLQRMRRKLGFILIAKGLRPESRAAILADYADLPVVEHFSPEELDRCFNMRGAKVLGFRKSTLTTSLLRELGDFRLRREAPPTPDAAAPASPTAGAVAATGEAISNGDPLGSVKWPPPNPSAVTNYPEPQTLPTTTSRPSPDRPADEASAPRRYHRARREDDRPRAWPKKPFNQPRGDRPYSAPRRDFGSAESTRSDPSRPARPWAKRPFRNFDGEQPHVPEQRGYDRPRPWASKPFDRPRGDRPPPAPRRDFGPVESTRNDQGRPARPWVKRPFRSSDPEQFHVPEQRGYDRPRPWAKTPFDRPRGDRPPPAPRRDFGPTESARNDQGQPARPWVKRPFRYSDAERPHFPEQRGYDRPRPWARPPSNHPQDKRPYPEPRKEYQRPGPSTQGVGRPPRPWSGKAFRPAYSTDSARPIRRER